MIILIAKIIFLVCILGILFIIVRKIPAISRLPREASVEKLSFRTIFILIKNIFKKLVSNNFFQNIFIGNLEKSLRKFKVVALKIDNIIDKIIRKLKRNSGNGMP